MKRVFSFLLVVLLTLPSLGFGAKNAAEDMQAVNQGDARTQTILGLKYLQGKGVKQDYVKAKELFRKACNNGFKPACGEYKK